MEKDVDQKFEEFIQRIYNQAKEKSLHGEEIPIAGELYVSHDKTKKEEIRLSKKAVLGLIAGFGVMTAGLKNAGDMDFATEVREEIFSQEEFSQEKNTFGSYANTLNDSELSKLYHDTAKEMREEGRKEEARQMETVVEELIADYSENQGFHK